MFSLIHRLSATSAVFCSSTVKGPVRVRIQESVVSLLVLCRGVPDSQRSFASSSLCGLPCCAPRCPGSLLQADAVEWEGQKESWRSPRPPWLGGAACSPSLTNSPFPSGHEEERERERHLPRWRWRPCRRPVPVAWLRSLCLAPLRHLFHLRCLCFCQFRVLWFCEYFSFAEKWLWRALEMEMYWIETIFARRS
jgi:hypothetical protein